MDDDRIATIRATALSGMRDSRAWTQEASQDVMELLDALETAQADLRTFQEWDGTPRDYLIRENEELRDTVSKCEQKQDEVRAERDAVQAENTRLRSDLQRLDNIATMRFDQRDRLTNQITDLTAVTREEVVRALQLAWDEWCVDTGCYPECLEKRGSKLYADFDRGNFAEHVANWLTAARFSPNEETAEEKT